ncbi:MAG: 3-dehydroquinate synthase [Pseudomonadota bacterium]|nr:3-dehydroquinate synthase [Pseudomonadota bacterium]
MKTLEVDLGDRAYPIHIGSGLLPLPHLIRPHLEGRNVMVVTDETVGPLYLARQMQALADYDTATVVLSDGEEHKTLETMGRIITALLTRRFDRQCALVALGGGVVGDITGFAAACYQRGVNYLQVPTTLLAQVDSSVGGKTAVNHPLGKNMIGAFHQPRCVIADTDTLATLPDREYRAGLAEVIKYGLIRDPELFLWIEEHLGNLLARDPVAQTHAIERSCRNKAEIVAADEREIGPRALLNLGHTFGHAIETGLGYGVWLHGEAVAAGMCLAARLSARLGWLDGAAVERIEALVRRAGLPVRAPAVLSAPEMRDLMAVDKKAREGALRLVLLEDLGKAIVTPGYDAAALDLTLAECRAKR